MRKLVSIALALAICVALAVVVSANTASKTVVSDTNVDVHGPLDHYAPLGHSDWGTPTNAVATWVHGNWPSIAGAAWISTAYYVEDPVNDSWRWFQGEMTLACTAYNIVSGTMVMATSDNAEEFYFNGAFVGSDGEVQVPFTDDQEWNTIISYAISPQPGVNTLDFIVRNYAQGGGIPTSNPTGLLYKATVDYEVPDVVWQPPITNLDFALQDGTTLPLKFKLYQQDGTLITNVQDVYLTVELDGTVVETWNLGDGIESLRWNEDYYIANFQTRNYNLVDGATYTAVVHDGCTGDMLGLFDFVLDTSKGTGRGNSGK